MDVPLPLPAFMALCEHKEKTGSRLQIHEMAGEAVREWLAAQKQRARAARAPAALSGYQWKDLYLPHGTLLRAVLNGHNIHAHVEGDSIVHDGNKVSPSQFVNAAGTTVRNAWTSVWILFPQQSVWKRADDCRVARASRKRSAPPAEIS
jgi:hypothetical protein